MFVKTEYILPWGMYRLWVWRDMLICVFQHGRGWYRSGDDTVDSDFFLSSEPAVVAEEPWPAPVSSRVSSVISARGPTEPAHCGNYRPVHIPQTQPPPTHAGLSAPQEVGLGECIWSEGQTSSLPYKISGERNYELRNLLLQKYNILTF